MAQLDSPLAYCLLLGAGVKDGDDAFPEDPKAKADTDGAWSGLPSALELLRLRETFQY